MNKCQLVRESCTKVISQSKFVKVDEGKIKEFADQLIKEIKQGYKYIQFDEYDCHYSDFTNDKQQLQYLFVLDSLNFCFWPSNWEYLNLAASLKKLLQKDSNVFSPKNLAKMDRNFVKQNIFENQEFSLLDERVRILNEVGNIALQEFEGDFLNIIEKAKHSAVKLLYILSSFFNNFQDHCLYKGQQICFYKRGQILIGDIYAAFKGKSYGQFDDIQELTMFPDYRVPQILNEFGIMKYENSLQTKINQKTELASGSEEEVEIRAGTVVSVELLKNYLKSQQILFKSIEIDWILWQKGEAIKSNCKPHHRVLSIFY